MKRIIFILMITVFAFNVFAVGSVFDDTVKFEAISDQDGGDVMRATPAPVIEVGTINSNGVDNNTAYNRKTTGLVGNQGTTLEDTVPYNYSDVVQTSIVGGSNSLKVFTKAISYLSCILTILIILSANVVKKKYVIKNVNAA